MQESGTESAGDVKNEEAFASPEIFEHAAKHPERQHVKKDVSQTPMHEHVGDDLMGSKVHRMYIVQSEQVFQVETGIVRENTLGKKHQEINNYKILDHGWDGLKIAHPEICHSIQFKREDRNV
jgi:hypothetical protein